MPQPDLVQIVTRLDTNLTLFRQSFEEHKEDIKKTLSDHIDEDKVVKEQYIKPLWENYQQQKGALKLSGTFASIAGGIIGSLLTYFGIKHGG